MKFRIPSFIFFLLFNCILHGQLELPYHQEDDIIINHNGYSLSFSIQHKQAEWVAYQLTKLKIQNGYLPRTNSFRPDPKIPELCASSYDYSNSYYDRGHLVPASDMRWSEKAMEESFYMSNISPQHYSFNRGAWIKLERRVRRWAVAYDSIYVVTAGVLNDNLQKIGLDSTLSVPEYFYKVILHSGNEDKKAIGFLMPNEKINKPIEHFAVSVDSIESATGIDFFFNIPDVLEEKLESSVDITLWNWD